MGVGWVKYLRRKFGKGFTFMIVPCSSGDVKSISIPFSAALLVFGIIVFNLYIFIGFTAQILQIHHFRQEIRTKNRLIAKLEYEQKEVKPTLRRSYQIAKELSRLKTERTRLLSAWRIVQQKGGRMSNQVSRGTIIRTQPYILSPRSKDKGVKTALIDLQNNQAQLTSYIKEELEEQHQLLLELLAYERRLDHTPSIWPVRSFFITSFFGNRFHPKFGYYKEHTGIDLQAGYRSTVCAAADGIIKFAGYRGGYGHTVVIDHGYGYETLYAHNSRILVHQGQSVKKNQKISLSGNSGTSTGPHLHYEVHINGHPVNPTAFLRK